MAGSNPTEAYHNFLGPLQRSLSCVTDAVLYTNRGITPDVDSQVLLSGQPVKLRGEAGLSLTVVHAFRIATAEEVGRADRFQVSTTAYFYQLAGADGAETLGYHWHPRQRNRVRFPHFHIGTGVTTVPADFRARHFPTGRVALEDVLRLAIVEFGVHPLRSDWETVLGESQDAFADWGTGRDPAPGSHLSTPQR